MDSITTRTTRGTKRQSSQTWTSYIYIHTHTHIYILTYVYLSIIMSEATVIQWVLDTRHLWPEAEKTKDLARVVRSVAATMCPFSLLMFVVMTASDEIDGCPCSHPQHLLQPELSYYIYHYIYLQTSSSQALISSFLCPLHSNLHSFSFHTHTLLT